MKKFEKIQIANEIFTTRTITTKDPSYNVFSLVGQNLKYLSDCYGRPSKSKECIYNYWVDYALSLENGLDYRVLDWGVESYNTNIFTFGILARKDNDLYKFRIYPTHNDLLIIKDYYTE